ncbi:MAG TPA: hypothetical protein VKU00_09385 [Chthonomonadaceae bacterium]|nr:hypothetical protein [Chthonomonadaceae bacterium]
MTNNYKPFALRAQRIFETLDWLKQDFGLTVSKNSPLEYIQELIRQEDTACQYQNLSMSGRLASSQTRAIRGLEWLCERLQRVRSSYSKQLKTAGQFKNRIKQMGVGIPSLCSTYNDFPNSVVFHLNASTDIFELVVGLAALEMGNNVVFESQQPPGQPDVRVTVEGVRWGFACKVSNTDNIEQHFHILTHAVTQTIKHLDRSLADRAVIVLCVQNVFSRPKMDYFSFSDAQANLERRTHEFVENVQRVIPEQRILDELLNRDSRIFPGAIIYFEDVFTIIESFSELILPGQPMMGQLTSQPISYAQYVTFGNRGLVLSDVPTKLAIALTGPNTEEISSIYD